MTLAELERYFKSRSRVKKRQEQEQASFDYILADLIGRSMARLYSSSAKMPSIEEVYSSIFDAEEIKKSKAQLNRQRFMAGLQQFAQSYNKDFEGGSKDK